MNQKTSFIVIAGTALLIGVLIHATIGLVGAVSSSSPGTNMSGAASNMTSGSISANQLDNSGSANTGGGLLGLNCGYSVTPTTSCGTTGH
jgi:hypothetical protein